MPYHLIQAGRRKEALSVLLDLQYVEAMAASGYVYELIDSLCHLLNSTAELKQSLENKLEGLEAKREREQARKDGCVVPCCWCGTSLARSPSWFMVPRYTSDYSKTMTMVMAMRVVGAACWHLSSPMPSRFLL